MQPAKPLRSFIQLSRLNSPKNAKSHTQDQYLQILLWNVIIVGAFTVLTLFGSLTGRNNWVVAVTTLIVYLWIIVVTLQRDLPYRVRALSAVILLFTIGVACLIDNALSGSGRLLFFACSVAATLLLGRRTGIITTILSTLTIYTIGALMLAGLISLPPISELTNSISPGAWVTAALIFFLVSAIAVIPLGKLSEALQLSISNESVPIQPKSEHKDSLNMQAANQVITLKAAINQEKTSSAILKACLRAVDLEELYSETSAILAQKYNAFRIEVYLNLPPSTFPILFSVHQPEKSGQIFTDPQPIFKQPNRFINLILEHRSPRQEILPSNPVLKRSKTFTLAVGIPILHSERSLGVMILYLSSQAKLKPAIIEQLQGFISILVEPASKQSLKLHSQIDPLAETNFIQACQAIGRATNLPQVIDAVAMYLTQISHEVIVVRPDKDQNWKLYRNSPGLKIASESQASLNFGRLHRVAAHLRNRAYILADATMVNQVFRMLGLTSLVPISYPAVFLPLWSTANLGALFIISTTAVDRVNEVIVRPFVSLMECARVAIEKISLITSLERRLAGLQSISSFRQTIAAVKTLEDLYPIIHQTIQTVVGKVDIIINLCQPENSEIMTVYTVVNEIRLPLPEQPLATGLSTTIIENRQSFLHNHGNKPACEILETNTPARGVKSWIGVPMISSEVALGAIILSDSIQEERFTKEDQDYLLAMAAEIALMIRKIRLFSGIQTRLQGKRVPRENIGQVPAGN